MSNSYLSRVSTATETLGREFDVWCNVTFWGGKPDQTVSEHAALDALAGKPTGCILCAILSVLVQWQHCPKTLQPGVTTPASAYARAGLCFIALLGAIGMRLDVLTSFVLATVLSWIVV